MIDSARLLADLTRLLDSLERDLRHQVAEHDDLRAPLKADYDAARQVERTQDTFETWCEEPITQAAVAWILGGVYTRFLEDNGLIEPMLSGLGARHTRAQQEHQHYFQQHPTHSERDYLEHVFGRLEALPPTGALFSRAHNPLWRLPLSADAARTLVEFWQRLDPDTGQVSHDFADPAWDTRFLGDLYQDLSAPVRKRYALLQTPRFVESFILDRTLTPAIDTFGYRDVRVIDPTCGSGHFLLGAFERLLALAQEHEPGREVRVLVQDVLSRVVGVDINPYATAIATFRLTVAALRACRIIQLADAPGFDVSVVAADSLLHGPRLATGEIGAVQTSMLQEHDVEQYYFAEDSSRVRALLGRQYHVVVGNPPYIAVRDRALNALYRQRYRTCHQQYSLVAPFTERFFELALAPSSSDTTRSGFVGLIVANTFMKREFGKALIERFLPRVDLTHVIDTSGASIPGHGTPTVIIFGRHRPASSDFVRVVMGIRGEPTTPDEPSQGLVWTAMLAQVDIVGSESAFISTADLPRMSLSGHPWSIGGGGAAALKELIDSKATSTLSRSATAIGRVAHTGADEAYVATVGTWKRFGIDSSQIVPMVEGDQVRDWTLRCDTEAIFPYGNDLRPDLRRSVAPILWLTKQVLNRRREPNGTHEEIGLTWFEWSRFQRERYKIPRGVAFAEVSTHNHFVLDHGGSIFRQTSPVIKLSSAKTDDDHVELLAVLNSSLACFWLKQVCQTKGSSGVGRGVYDERWEFFYQFGSTKLAEFPLVPCREGVRLAHRLDSIGRKLGELAVSPLGSHAEQGSRLTLASKALETMISLQEDLDWEIYAAYGLVPKDELCSKSESPSVRLGQRAFEVVLARKIARGDLETTWFDRHSSTPITELPSEWPSHYRALVERRIALIESDRNIGLIEQPEYKRRWNIEPFEERVAGHLRDWLCGRLETTEYWAAVSISSVTRLADRATQDAEFMRVAEAYLHDPAFDVPRLVEELVTQGSVPFLPALRYRDTGLSKRAQWERTWDLQRQEDAGIAVGDIPVPPSYTSADFKDTTSWRLRGKLDVPKERFISFPGCERAADGSLPLAWAGWNHAEQARALGAYYMQIKNEEGTVPTKLVPLLAGLLELLPWVRQWHPGTDPEFGFNLGEYYASFVDTEARALGLTVDQVRAWQPEAAPRRGRRRSAEGN